MQRTTDQAWQAAVGAPLDRVVRRCVVLQAQGVWAMRRTFVCALPARHAGVLRHTNLCMHSMDLRKDTAKGKKLHCIFVWWPTVRSYGSSLLLAAERGGGVPTTSFAYA
jgi:hypothetical protein